MPVSNDIVAAFERYKAGASADAAVADVEAAGETLAAQVNRIAAAGGRVIVSTGSRRQRHALRRLALEDAEQLTTLTGRFNARLLVTINNNRAVDRPDRNPP